MPVDVHTLPPGRVDMGGYTLIENAPLAQRNTLRVAAKAKLLAELRDVSKLPEILDFPAIRSGPIQVLGEGSNVLFTGDYAGTVLVMANQGVQVEHQGNITRLAVAAGERWDDFVRWTLGQGLAGMENLILIPGTVGASPIQNIGAYGVEVAEFIESVEAWDTQSHAVVTLDRDACEFAYRNSVFKREPGRYIVTAVRFALPRQRELKLDYAGIRDELSRMGVEKPAPFHVAEAVVHLRTRKLPDPAVIGNAGSFFKNPIVDAMQGEALKRKYAELPAWQTADGRWKLSAAWLIETVGLKGERDGDAGISNRHALVLVNHGQATGRQLWAFSQRVITTVQEQFGVRLEREPLVIGG